MDIDFYTKDQSRLYTVALSFSVLDLNNYQLALKGGRGHVVKSLIKSCPILLLCVITLAV
jgi:hypothetical protein